MTLPAVWQCVCDASAVSVMTRIRIRNLHSKLAEAGGYNSVENTGYILESVMPLPLLAISVVNTALMCSAACAAGAADAERGYCGCHKS